MSDLEIILPRFKLDSGCLLAVGLRKTLASLFSVLSSLNGDHKIEHLINVIMIMNSFKISPGMRIKI